MTERLNTPLEPSAASDFASRRRFVQASVLALPAVMTLRSGQAVAQSSFGTACLTETNEMGEVALDSQGNALYYIVDTDAEGRVLSIRQAQQKDLGARTITPSCALSLGIGVG